MVGGDPGDSRSLPRPPKLLQVAPTSLPRPEHLLSLRSGFLQAAAAPCPYLPWSHSQGRTLCGLLLCSPESAQLGATWVALGLLFGSPGSE